MAKNTASLIMEFIWLALGAALIVIAFRITANNSLREAFLFYALSAVSFFMYFFRRRLRQKELKKK